MIFRFNSAQLGTVMEKALNTLLAEIQKTQENEIEVIADSFPYNLIVAAGGFQAKICWDVEAQMYKYVGEPLPPSTEWLRQQQKPESQKETADLPVQAPAAEKKVTVDSLVSQFMGLSLDQRAEFFAEVWLRYGS